MTKWIERAAAGALVAAALALGACGGGNGNDSAPALAAVHTDVVAVRSAATAQDVAATQAALAKLRTDVAQLRTQGKLSSQRVTNILAAAAAVEAQLGALPPPTTVPPPTDVTPAPAPAPAHRRTGGKHKD